MLKKILLLFVVFLSIQSQAQKLIYKSNGNIRDVENNKVSPNNVRALLAKNQNLLDDYNVGRTKKTAGNVLIIGGIGLLVTDILVELYSSPDYDKYYVPKKRYPSALTYIGLAAIVIAIPVKIGFSKKIRNAVDAYNNNIETVGLREKIEFITNNNGVGFRLTLN